jgi:tRNA dimethylallyltransferase
MQLYRGMDIGTAKIPPADRRGVPHHLLDVLDVRESANVAAYQHQARAVMDDIEARGGVPLLVGGSGLYVRAALDSARVPRHRARPCATGWRPELAAAGPAPLHARLAAVDPAAAAAILPTNGRRLVRALEVLEITGRPFSATLPSFAYVRPAVQVALEVPRDELDARIERRVDRMWEQGLVEEVAAAGVAHGCARAYGLSVPSATHRCSATSTATARWTRRGRTRCGPPAVSRAARSRGSGGIPGSDGCHRAATVQGWRRLSPR